MGWVTDGFGIGRIVGNCGGREEAGRKEMKGRGWEIVKGCDWQVG
jgi:hypothetical protein